MASTKFAAVEAPAAWPAAVGQAGNVIAAVNGAGSGVLPAYGALVIEEMI